MGLLQLDQAGLPLGTPGRSRTDGLPTGGLITLTNVGAAPGETLIELLWAPAGDANASISTLAESSPGSNVWTMAPTAGLYGSYEFLLTHRDGQPDETKERRKLVVRTPLAGLAIPSLNEIADPKASLLLRGAAQTVASIDNAQDYTGALATLDYAGWWRWMHEVSTQVESLFALSGGGQSVYDYVVTQPSDFPGFSGGVFTLPSATYAIVGEVDIGADQLKIDENAKVYFHGLGSGSVVGLNPTGVLSMGPSSFFRLSQGAIKQQVIGDVAIVTDTNCVLESDMALIQGEVSSGGSVELCNTELDGYGSAACITPLVNWKLHKLVNCYTHNVTDGVFRLNSVPGNYTIRWHGGRAENCSKLVDSSMQFPNSLRLQITDLEVAADVEDLMQFAFALGDEFITLERIQAYSSSINVLSGVVVPKMSVWNCVFHNQTGDPWGGLFSSATPGMNLRGNRKQGGAFLAESAII